MALGIQPRGVHRLSWLSERDLARQASVRLFCLPHAGSGAAGFYRWKRLLPASIAVCPVLLPGREARLAEPPLRSAAAIVAALQAEARPHLTQPYALFGHSMSALLALEWARTIQREDLPAPLCLFVSGRNAPQQIPGHHNLHRIDDLDLLRELEARYGGASGILDDPELRALYLPILRADLEVVETYAYDPGPPLHCPVRAFAGVDDRSVSTEGLAQWSSVTTRTFAAQRFPGDHFYHLGAGQFGLLHTVAQQLEA